MRRVGAPTVDRGLRVLGSSERGSVLIYSARLRLAARSACQELSEQFRGGMPNPFFGDGTARPAGEALASSRRTRSAHPDALWSGSLQAERVSAERAARPRRAEKIRRKASRHTR